MSDKHSTPGREPLYAVAAEYGSPEDALAGAAALRGLRLGRLDIHSPVPLEGAMEAIGSTPAPIPYYMATGAFVLGFAAMMGMCVYATAYDYVFNIGGRPLVSWQAFMVPSVSFATLLSAATVFFNMTFLNRLPLLNHPAFNIPGYLRATQDRFFVTVAAGQGPSKVEERFDPDRIERAFRERGPRPLRVHRVPR